MDIKRAIVTVTDRNFIKGTMALFYSILKHNKNLDVDFIIIHNDLNDDHKKILSVFPNVLFIEPNELLLKRINVLGMCIPTYVNAQRKFFNLEIFNLQQYTQVLYLDSDIVCCGGLKPLFENTSYPLMVSPDRFFYLNIKRDPITFLPCEEEPGQKDNSCLYCFNSGMMLINMPLLKKDTFDEMIKLLSPIIYADIQTGHSDQFLLNRYFHNTFKFVSGKYNFLLHVEEEQLKIEGLKKEEAVLLHYVKYPKPWSAKNMEYYVDNKNWKNIYDQCLAWIESEHLYAHKLIQANV